MDSDELTPDADASEGSVDSAPAEAPDSAPSTWASTGGGLEQVQEGGGSWPPASGQLEEFGKAMTDDE